MLRLAFNVDIFSLDSVAILPCQRRWSFPGRYEEWRLQGMTSVTQDS